MKRIIIFVLLIAFCFTFGKSLVACATDGRATESGQKTKYTYLIIGFDDAFDNTDALILASYDTKTNEASFVQIPRDTYVYYRGRGMKINGVYPTLLREQEDGFKSALEFSSFVGTLLGVSIDGFVGFTADAFSRLINHIGGVDITFKTDFVYKDDNGELDIDIKKGTHHLSGEEALRFVRYRRGYALGDLGRIDAQKLFLSAFITKLKGSINPTTAFRMMCDSGEGVISNIRLSNVLGIALKKNGRLVDAKIKYANLPGQAALTIKGVSYYVCNAKASRELFMTLGYNFTLFDKEGSFKPRSEKKLLDIYNSNSINSRIYDDSELTKIEIPSKDNQKG